MAGVSTLKSAPAFATGVVFVALGATVTVMESLWLSVPSLTDTEKTKVVEVVTVGATKVGKAVLPPVRDTVVPEDWLQV